MTSSTSSQTEQPSAGRLPYEKPALRSISLVADQVLGVGCKISTQANTNSGGAPGCGVLVQHCSADGS